MRMPKKFLLLNVYRPPSGSFQNICDIITESLEDIALFENIETFVLGDFNVDINNPQNLNGISLIENFRHLGLSKKIEENSRHSRNSRSSLIDHIYTNSKFIQEAGNVTLNISDHDLIYVIKKKKKTINKKLTFFGVDLIKTTIEINSKMPLLKRTGINLMK